MTTLSSDAVVSAAPNYVAATVDGQEVVLNDETGTYHGLGGVGPTVWRQVRVPRPLGRVVEAVADEYDVPPDRCEAAVRSLLSELADAGLVTVHER
jgi:hypothetical protein